MIKFYVATLSILVCISALADDRPVFPEQFDFSDRLEQFNERMHQGISQPYPYTDEQQAILDECAKSQWQDKETCPLPGSGGQRSKPTMLADYLGVAYKPAWNVPIMLLKPDLERIGAWGHDDHMAIAQALPELFNIQVIAADHYVEFELPATTLLDITFTNGEGVMMGVEAAMELRDGAYYFSSVNGVESDIEMSLLMMPQAKKGWRGVIMELDYLAGFTFPDTRPPTGNAVIWSVRYGEVRVDTGFIWAGRWMNDWYPTEQTGFLRGTMTE